MEETLYMNNGQLATRGPGNYKIPAFLDTPSDMRISFLKVQDPSPPPCPNTTSI